MTSSVTLEQIDVAMAQLAELIERSPEGNAYWPIFDRLEREREHAGGRVGRLEAARQRVTLKSRGRRAA
jgi:hypothetical protein